MKKSVILILTLGLIFHTSALISKNLESLTQHNDKQLVAQNLYLSPLCFTENQGQWDERALFRADAGGAAMWFTEDAVYYQLVRGIPKNDLDEDDPLNSLHEKIGQRPGSLEQLVIRASFVGANPNPEIRGQDPMEYKCNYFIGNDPGQWHTDVPNYQSIYLKELYPGIDLKFYGNREQMEYDFIVSPGVDYTKIQVQYEGAESLNINSSGELIIETKWGNIIERKPVVYQMDGNKRTEIEGKYELKRNNSFSFKLNKNYDPDLPLIIDPILIYSTYLGGASLDNGLGIALDASGCAYVAGYTYSPDFPLQSPYQDTLVFLADVFVTKISNSGDNLVYSTYLGGSNDDNGVDVAIDDQGCAYIVGVTVSVNYPTVNAYQSWQGDFDVFASKLSASGDSLIYSTYLGGNDYDYGSSIAVDDSGFAYVTGTAYIGFPTVNPFQTYQGNNDAFVTKLSIAGNELVYSTYLGGYAGDGGMGIAVDASGSAFVTGGTSSVNFPLSNPFQVYQGNHDAFVTKLSPSGNSLDYSTYLGGDSIDVAYSIAIDNSGNAYIAGATFSADFPTLNPIQPYNEDDYDAFVTKLSSSGNSLLYSTCLGGSEQDRARAIAVDIYGCAYITGYTISPDFPAYDPYPTWHGSSDVFISKLSTGGNILVYSTYLGGGDLDEGLGIAVDDSGCAYVTGWTKSIGFPTVNPYQTYQANSDVFITKLSQGYLDQYAIISFDRSGSMTLTNPMGQSRLERAKSLAHDEVDRLLDFNDPEYPGAYQVAVMSFNADGIVLLQDFTSGAELLHNIIDMISDPRHDTPLAAAMCQAHCMFSDLDATAKYVFTYTDGLENESQNFEMCDVCEPCNYLVGTGWNYDCDPSNPSSCTDWQLCLHDQFALTGINIVHYFGEPINPFDKGMTSGLEDMYFLKNTAEESDGEFLYHSDQVTKCGDANSDGSLNVSDAMYIIVYIFQGGTPPVYVASADVNCDGSVNISDAVRIINYVFIEGDIPCDTDGDGIPDC